MTDARPVPPPEWELRRVAAQLELLDQPGDCPHCSARWVPIPSSGHPDAPTVFRAAELRHEPGCPDDA